jgi:hypothetical protein
VTDNRGRCNKVKPMIKCTSEICLIGLTQQGHKWEEQIHPKRYYWSYKTFIFNYSNCLNEIEKYLKLDRGENLCKHYSLVSIWVFCQPPHTTTAKFKQKNTLVTERRCKAHDKMHFKNKSERVRIYKILSQGSCKRQGSRGPRMGIRELAHTRFVYTLEKFCCLHFRE